MPKIHPTAIVDAKAELADDVEVGAFAIIRGHVKIGAGTVVQDRTHILGPTTIGQRCKLGPLAFIGLDPQHMRYNGEPTKLIIGDDVTIREMANIHRAFKTGPEDATRIGDRCYLMHSSHVGHDCVVANDVIISAGVMLAGHCTIAERVFIGGGTAIHQFCRVGRLCILAGNEGISRDCPPFSAARYGGLKAYNAIGCRRAGICQEAIHAIRSAFYCLHHNRTLPRAIEEIQRTVPMVAEIRELLEFLTTTKRGIQPSVHFRRPFQDED
jgi:UDP-N-acetylglucosamine acyltransferase